MVKQSFSQHNELESPNCPNRFHKRGRRNNDNLPALYSKSTFHAPGYDECIAAFESACRGNKDQCSMYFFPRIDICGHLLQLQTTLAIQDYCPPNQTLFFEQCILKNLFVLLPFHALAVSPDNMKMVRHDNETKNLHSFIINQKLKAAYNNVFVLIFFE